jgi:spore germination protein
LIIYVVKPGDSLFRISRLFGVDTQTIIATNQLQFPERLVIGQSLIIPTEQASVLPTRYAVQPGDSLWGIANRYGTSLETLVRINNIINPALIYPGQVISIPVGFIPAAAGAFAYTIQPGDTLWLIAQRFGVSLQSLVAVNRLPEPSRLVPGQVITVPTREAPKPNFEVNGYILPSTDPAAIRSAISPVGPHLTYITVFSYTVNADGSLNPVNDQPIIETAEANRIAPLLVVTNFDGENFNTQLAQTLLNTPEARRNLIRNISATLKARGYQGVNVDFEHMRPEDRDAYNRFIRELKDSVTPEGFSTSIAVAPKTADFKTGEWIGTFDYPTLGGIVDFMMIMTYEWGWVGGPPMAVAPINMVRRVIQYATSVMDPKKILMGMNLYGYDWTLPDTPENLASTVTPQQAIRIAVTRGTVIRYDETAQSPWFRYTDENGALHELWFEDARSVREKYDLAVSFGLRGVSYWLIGYDFPQNWPILQSMANIVKK